MSTTSRSSATSVLVNDTRIRLPPSRVTVSSWDGLSTRSEEHTSELQSLRHLVCRLLLEKKKKLQDLVGHAQLPFRNGQPDRRGSEALAQRAQDVRRVGGIRRPTPFGDNVTRTLQHKAM